MRYKLVAMMYSAMLTRDNDRLMYGEARLTIEELADYLLSRGVTVQTTPISYERLLWLAREMHSWIYLNCDNELDIYNKLGITEEENYVFGYGGRAEMPLPKAPKEVE